MLARAGWLAAGNVPLGEGPPSTRGDQQLMDYNIALHIAASNEPLGEGPPCTQGDLQLDDFDAAASEPHSISAAVAEAAVALCETSAPDVGLSPARSVSVLE